MKHINTQLLCNKFLLVFLLCMLSGLQSMYAQQLSCGTAAPTAEQKELLRRLGKLNPSQNKVEATEGVATYFPVAAYILRKTDGTGGVSELEIMRGLAETNKQFRSIDVQFYICGGFNYVNNDTYYSFVSSDEGALVMAGNFQAGKINIYYANTVTSGGTSVGGYAWLPGGPERIFIKNSQANDDKTVPHEMGHYFGLLHTFQDSNNGTVTERELVTRGGGANCTTKGDDICDTPADPFERTGGNSISSCVYTGVITDANAAVYTPLTSNIMGYYFNCGNDFTAGQYARMQGVAGSSRNYSAATCAATLPTASVLNSLSMVATGVNLTWNDVANELGYYIERSIDNINFTAVAAVNANVTTYIDVSATSNTLYYYRIKPTNSPAQFSNVESIITSLVYCIPAYNFTCVGDAVIDDFIFTGTTNINNINSNCGNPNYTFYNALSANVAKGGTYNFTANFNTGATGVYFPQNIAIWVDVNNDGTFDASERLFQSNLASSQISISGSITIPLSAQSGAIRMRVRSRHRGEGVVTDPCATYNQGETEDYTLNISGGNDNTSRVEAPTTQVATANINIGAADANVFTFKISDLGTSDAVPTNVTQVRIRQGIGNTVSSWIGKITNAKLFDGATQITATPTINANDITFAITSTNLSIANNSSKEITLKITLGTTGFVENDKLAFQVLASTHGFTSAASGSSEFATTFPAAITGNLMNLIIPPALGDVVVNEFVTAPQQDWSTNNFNGTIGAGAVSQGADEWIELYIKRAGMNLTGWTIELLDGTNVTGNLTTVGGAFTTSNYITTAGGTFTNTKIGDYILLGNVIGGEMENTNLTINLKDPSGTIIDQVVVGVNATSAGAATGSVTTGAADEAMARVPNGTKTGNDNTDFKKQTATIGKVNTPDLIVTTTVTLSGNYNNVTIKNTGILTLNGTINAEGTFLIETGGQLLSNCNLVTGTSSFTMQSGTTIEICDDDGITTSGATGTVRVTGTRTYNGDATFIYKSFKIAQQTGNGLPPQVTNLIIDAREAGVAMNTVGSGSDVTLTNLTVVNRLVELRNGNLVANGKLTLASNASQTAMVIQKSDGLNIVKGDVTVHRHITGGQAVYPAAYAGPGGYHYFSSPISTNNTASQVADNLSLVLNSNYDWVNTYSGAFPNFYFYDESRVQATAPNDVFEKGWNSPANTSAFLSPMRGFIINVAAGNSLDFLGNLNNGNLTTATPINLTMGVSPNAGWHLMGNPYPAPISLKGLKALNPNIKNEFLRRIPTGQYAGTWASYVPPVPPMVGDGIGINTGTNAEGDKVSMGQGFFVRAEMNNIAYIMNNSVRFATYENPTFFKTENDGLPRNGMIKLGVRQGKFSDETAIYFEQGASADYDQYDAEKARFNSQPVPSIYTTSIDNKNLAINGLPSFSDEFAIPLTIYSYDRGAHTISLNEFDYFRKYVQVYLEDKQLDVLYNLTQKRDYQFNVNSAGFQKDRFVIRFSNATTVNGDLDFFTIFPNPSNGEVKLRMFSNYKGEVAVSVYDMIGKIHKVLTINKKLNMFETDLNFQDLPNGIYIIEITDANGKKIRKISKL